MLSYEIVDVFTDRAYAGNPLAVVLDAEGLSTASMSAMAREFHLSETAFPLPASDADYRLRIFTPGAELPFAGHPSVGTAWLLAQLGRIPAGRVRQACGAGIVSLDVSATGATLTGAPPYAGGPVDPEPLLAAVGLHAVDLAGEPRVAGTGLSFGYLLVSDAAVGRCSLDLAALGRLPGFGGVSVVSYAAGRAHARVFAADVGEDPATGSAALGLGAYLAAAGLVGDGETAYVISQGAEMGRPSTLTCAVVVAGGRAVECRVGGGVVRVAQGEIAPP